MYAGSIPTLASIFSTPCPGGGIGRRCGLKIHFEKSSAGSSPAPGTIADVALPVSVLLAVAKSGVSVKSVTLFK